MSSINDNDDQPVPTPWSRLREDVAVVTWSSFLVACVATMLFFALIDPDYLIDVLNHPRWLPSRMAGYALGFFFFWFISACAASLTAYMLDTSREHFRSGTRSNSKQDAP